MTSGEDFKTFIKKEQAVVMTEYEVMYEKSFKNLDLMKEFYVSMMVAGMFMILFIALLPMLMDMNMDLMLVGVLFLIVIIEALIIVYVKFMMPADDVWHSMDIRPKLDENIKKVLPIVAILSLLILIAGITIFTIPTEMFIALISTPFLIIGLMIYKDENDLKRCDDNYDAFMRSIGSVVETTGGSLEDAIEKLKIHDFGPLTEKVVKLHSRLLTRIDKPRAWSFFTNDTGSNLISKFTEMYIKSIRSGGSATEIGSIISDNYIRMLSLRKRRYQEANNFSGVLYGLMVGISMTLFLTLGIMSMMNNAFESVTISDNVGLPILVTSYDIPVLTVFMTLIVAIHAIASTIILKLVSGNHKFSPMLHFPLMIWIAAISGLFSRMSISTFL